MREQRMITLPTTQCGDVFIHVPVGHVTNTLEIDIRDVLCACATNFNNVNTPWNLHNKKGFGTENSQWNDLCEVKGNITGCSWCKNRKKSR